LKKVLKVIAETTAALSFTLAGFVVVAATLSGDTREIALWTNGVAIFITYIYQIITSFKDE
jgi:hypothetical protein